MYRAITLIVLTIGTLAASLAAALFGALLARHDARIVRLDTSTPHAITIEPGNVIALPPAARAEYRIQLIGTDGDDAPILQTWTITTEPRR